MKQPVALQAFYKPHLKSLWFFSIGLQGHNQFDSRTNFPVHVQFGSWFSSWFSRELHFSGSCPSLLLQVNQIPAPEPHPSPASLGRVVHVNCYTRTEFQRKALILYCQHAAGTSFISSVYNQRIKNQIYKYINIYFLFFYFIHYCLYWFCGLIFKLYTHNKAWQPGLVSTKLLKQCPESELYITHDFQLAVQLASMWNYPLAQHEVFRLDSIAHLIGNGQKSNFCVEQYIPSLDCCFLADSSHWSSVGFSATGNFWGRVFEGNVYTG